MEGNRIRILVCLGRFFKSHRFHGLTQISSNFLGDSKKKRNFGGKVKRFNN